MSITKPFWLSALLFMPLISLAQGTAGYQVIGQVKGLSDGAKLYLIDGNQRKIIDSASVHQEQFTLRGQLREPAHIYLHIGRGRVSKKLADILLDNRTVYVKGSYPAYDSVTVSGSDIDRQWKAWMKEDEQIGLQRYRLKQVHQFLVAQKDTANATALSKLIGNMQQSRVRLLKSYVQRYHDSATGAALPTLCTLEASLTGNDYLEMYQVLTPTWKQSTFGKETLSQATKKNKGLLSPK